MDLMCRLCSKQKPSLTPIFSFGKGGFIADLITILIPIKFDVETLPSKICDDCLEVVQKCIELRDKALICDIHFRTGKILPTQVQPEFIKVEEVEEPEVEEDSDAASDEEMSDDESQVLDSNDVLDLDASSDGPFKCSECPEVFHYHQSIAKHMLSFHSKDLPFTCDQCTFRFGTEGKLKNHVINVHETRFAVEIPNRDDEDISECEHCGQKFEGSRLRLERHLLLNHRPELNEILKCHMCDREFVFGKSLHRHILVHRKATRNESAFKCEFCTKKFLSKVRLQSHL